jgi:hypothetical protein
MGNTLSGLTPSQTFQGLIKVGNNTNVDGTAKVLSDGAGTDLPMEVSTAGVNLTGSPTVNSVAIANTNEVAAKQDTLVSGTNIKTINGTSVLGSGDIVTPSTPPSGAAGAIQFTDGSAFASDAANLFWDDANNRLGVGTDAPSATTHIKGSGTTSATTSLLVQNSAGLSSLQVLDDTSVFNNGAGAVASNTAFGSSALIANTTGNSNTAIGQESLRLTTTGIGNTANGSNASRNNTTGANNTANGYLALQNNVTGSNNTALGRSALRNNTASNNTAVGFEAALTNTSGTGITAIGFNALRLSTGNDNTAVGAFALDANTTGTNNTANGANALTSNTFGGSNTAIGTLSLRFNTSGSNNVAVGFEAGRGNNSGTGITAIGYQALRASTGNDNTALGFQAGDNITTGAGNVCIGSGAEPLAATDSNQFVVGTAAVNAGAVTTETVVQTKTWSVIINGVAQKILLA